MRFRNDKDLFEESTMTFGQHLEELRVCLFKAVLGLVVGVIIGLYFGGNVVEFIQKPLAAALSNYYQKQSLSRAKAKLAELQAQGKPLPETPEQIAELVNNEQVLPEEVLVNPADLVEQLRQRYPDLAKSLPELPRDAAKKLNRGDMLRLFVWHRLEDDARIRIKTLSAHEAFTIYMKASFLVGAIVSSPWVFYQLWIFVAAGLYRHERRYIHVFLPFSLALFLAGAALAFFVVFKPVLSFLFSFNEWMGIEPDPRISEWLGFVLMLPLGFGVGFQLPLVMLFLERIGIFTAASYLAQWRISVLVIAVVAMVLTPPDPYSMLLMAGPLTALYFGGILLCRVMPRLHSGSTSVQRT